MDRTPSEKSRKRSCPSDSEQPHEALPADASTPAAAAHPPSNQDVINTFMGQARALADLCHTADRLHSQVRQDQVTVQRALHERQRELDAMRRERDNMRRERDEARTAQLLAEQRCQQQAAAAAAAGRALSALSSILCLCMHQMVTFALLIQALQGMEEAIEILPASLVPLVLQLARPDVVMQMMMQHYLQRCTVCQAAVGRWAFPCGHIAYCMSCFSRAQDNGLFSCPLCRHRGPPMQLYTNQPSLPQMQPHFHTNSNPMTLGRIRDLLLQHACTTEVERTLLSEVHLPVVPGPLPAALLQQLLSQPAPAQPAPAQPAPAQQPSGGVVDLADDDESDFDDEEYEEEEEELDENDTNSN